MKSRYTRYYNFQIGVCICTACLIFFACVALLISISTNHKRYEATNTAAKLRVFEESIHEWSEQNRVPVADVNTVKVNGRSLKAVPNKPMVFK